MQRRSRLVLCCCKSRCTTHNPITGLHEGEGHYISRSNRDSHARDDQLQRALITENPSFANIPSCKVQVLRTLPVTSRRIPLVFRNNPALSGPFGAPTDHEIVIPNRGMHALTNDSANQAFLEIEARYCELCAFAQRMDPADEMTHLLDILHLELRRLTREKQVQWSEQRSVVGKAYVNTEMYFASIPGSDMRKAGCLVTLVLQFVYFTPRRALRTQLAGLRSLLRAAGVTPDIQDDIPLDARTASKLFDIQPITDQYIACPSCHSLYPYNPGDNPQTSVDRCIYRRTENSEICETSLWKTTERLPGNPIPTPRMKYLHQDLKAWLGRLLSRKDMEKILDSRPHIPPDDPNAGIDDIWLSKVFLDLKDPSGASFYPGRNGEGRLIFALAVNGFNPFQNKTAKQSVSSTAIWLVLLNLPPDLRYLHENLYVAGVIPGYPSLDEINHYLDLLINKLLILWDPGVFFSRTYSNIVGRLYRAMCIPLICDMIAARQVLGQSAATSHNCCTLCDIDYHDFDIIDHREWPKKNCDHMKECARLWRDATSEEEQDFYFQAYGIRWTSLLRLPYWDPTKYAVVESMHAGDLGLLMYHCRTLFGIDVTKAGGDGFSSIPYVGPSKVVTTKQDLRLLKTCSEIVHANAGDLLNRLLRYGHRVLYTFCSDNNIIAPGHSVIVGTRYILANNILDWRRSARYHQPEEVLDDPNDQEHNEPLEDAVNIVPEENVTVTDTLLIRIIRGLITTEERENNRKKAYSQATTENLATLCEMLRVDITDIDITRRRIAKPALFNRIKAFSNHDPTKIDTSAPNMNMLRMFLSEPDRATPRRIVLGSTVMDQVWADMTRTTLPSWITAAPHNWGTSSRGKLSAAHWRVICTIHLPITLIRLWKEDNGRLKDLLDHFMDLVTSIKIANMRLSSPRQVDRYNLHIRRYVSRITTLYPDRKLVPNHHAALHIGDVLQNFGPVPFFERYINFFHHINTNQKIGELESTYMNTSASSANIRAILADNEHLCQIVYEMTDVMDDIALEDARGFRLASILNPNTPNATSRFKSLTSVIEQEYLPLLQALCGAGSRILPEAIFFKEVSIRGVCYAIYGSTARRNSYVQFQLSDTEVEAGKIEQIFRCQYSLAGEDEEELEDVFLVVRTVISIDVDTDPYRRYDLAGFLARPTGGILTVIRMSQVNCHCVITHMIAEYEGLIHVLPVDRLMDSFPIEDNVELEQEI
ncbi:hypothetical protein HYPSUDRAFT_72760 [Hypholoma sublateritium FD-334 SS-4]|uniref:Uncharacterized protein n=1 Tax=Hypholoma sublateritium (strain FD-334 SS-4) TaxID=945553 RepID=A0A0D2N4G9_HYPSF|nr:hypothetical protein HYPSUDRAFT_72760 [Hypholoma sublateritium FD-334 SS-4]